MSNKVGRPTLYDEAMQARADEYINASAKQLKEAIPSHVGLAMYLGVTKTTVYEWAKHYPEFSATLEVVSNCQEQSAMNNGIRGVFNSTITKLVLANHGYSDKRDIAHSSPDGSMSPKGMDDFYKDEK